MSEAPLPATATLGWVAVEPPRLRPVSRPTDSAVGTPAVAQASSGETVTLTIDGRQVEAAKGAWIIDAADRAGVYIPRFCYHPRMKPVGMCRMCLVEVKGPRGFSLMPACYNPVADGMEIRTQSDATKKAQDGVLEFLLVNHPLDCPVCDKGGECPLQDQTLAYGPGESRFVEEKRHWDKPIPISELVYLDRERCIQCGRCVRFADEVAGDPLIDFAERGDETEVATFPDAPFSSYFSGNIVQICPVGALTAKPYRFRARPWDLEQVESSCTSCSVGCRVAVQASGDELTRYIGVDSGPVNWGWLCDKGRFGFQGVNSPDRLTAPMVRRGDELVEVSWGEALDAAAAGLAAAKRAGGGGSLAVIGGARLANEDAYAWAKTARVALGTDHVDAQLGDGLPADVLLGLPRATIDQAANAPLVITLGPDVKDELPIVFLRLREAAEEGRTQIVELASRPTGLSEYAALSLHYRPGEVAGLVAALVAPGDVPEAVAGVAGAQLQELRAHLDRAWQKGAEGAPSVVVVLGRGSLAESEGTVAEAAQLLAGLPGVAFLSALRRSNVHGALDLGLAPGMLPGRVSLDEGRAWYEQEWGTQLPEKPGLGTAGILDAATHGRVAGLVLVGADPETDFPDAGLALRGLLGARFTVAIDTYLTPSSRRADVVLPAATFAERRGTFTNLEGRVTWLGQMVTAPGVAWPDWVIASELAARLGADFGWSSLEDIWAEVAAVSPLHQGLTYEVLAGADARDGVVVPYDPSAPRSVPHSLDPMADPGITSAERHNVPAASLAALVDPELAAPASADASDGDVPRPAPTEWATTPAASTAPAPADGDEALRLVTRRSLWDSGTQLQHSESLSSLHPQLVASLHPGELARLGLADGEMVRVSSSRGALVLPVVADAAMALGTVVVPWNLPGGSASSLVDSSTEATEVLVRPLREVN